MQNAYAVAIRAEVRRHYSSLKEYAQTAGVDYQRLTKMLRGEAIMRLEDIASAHRHLGITISVPGQVGLDPRPGPVGLGAGLRDRGGDGGTR